MLFSKCIAGTLLIASFLASADTFINEKGQVCTVSTMSVTHDYIELYPGGLPKFPGMFLCNINYMPRINDTLSDVIFAQLCYHIGRQYNEEAEKEFFNAGRCANIRAFNAEHERYERTFNEELAKLQARLRIHCFDYTSPLFDRDLYDTILYNPQDPAQE